MQLLQIFQAALLLASFVAAQPVKTGGSVKLTGFEERDVTARHLSPLQDDVEDAHLSPLRRKIIKRHLSPLHDGEVDGHLSSLRGDINNRHPPQPSPRSG